MLEKHPTLIPKEITIDTIDNILETAGYKKDFLILSRGFSKAGLRRFTQKLNQF